MNEDVVLGIMDTNIKDYSTSLISSTVYVGQVNVNPNLHGNWKTVIQSQGSYNIKVLGNRDTCISENLYQLDSSSMYGFSNIEGKVSQGNAVNSGYWNCLYYL